MNTISKLSDESKAADRIPIKALRNKMKRRAAIAKFVMVIVYDKDGVRMSLRYRKVMNNM